MFVNIGVNCVTLSFAFGKMRLNRKQKKRVAAIVMLHLLRKRARSGKKSQLDFVVGKFVRTRRNCRQLVANSIHTADATHLYSAKPADLDCKVEFLEENLPSQDSCVLGWFAI